MGTSSLASGQRVADLMQAGQNSPRPAHITAAVTFRAADERDRAGQAPHPMQLGGKYLHGIRVKVGHHATARSAARRSRARRTVE